MSKNDQLIEEYGDQIEWSYDCIDRIVVNGMFLLGQSPGGFRTWWRSFDPREERLNDKGMQQFAGDFSRRVTAFCDRNKVPLIKCGAGVRKEDVAEPYIQAARKNDRTGLFLILTNMAPAPVWKVSLSQRGSIRDIHREKPWPYVKHYYFHIMDQEWGHLIVRVCGYPPYGVQVILNGHEWVERKLVAHGWNVLTDDNCFTGYGDASRAVHYWCNQLMKSSTAQALERVCAEWCYGTVVPFAMHSQERDESGFGYSWRLFQLEYCRNYVFKSGRVMDEIFQSLIDRSRNRYDLKQVKTIFGVRGRPHKRLRSANEPRGRRDAAFKEVSKPEFDLTVFKLHWLLSTLKLYDKSGRLLRGEAVEHNLKKSKHRGHLEFWCEIIEEAKEKLLRFINAAELLDHGLIDAGRLDYWHEPTQRGKKRLAGIDIENARMQLVLDALASLALVTGGFTRKQLTAEVNSRIPSRRQKYKPRQISYDMSKLRGKGLIEQIPHSRKNKINLRKLRPLITLVTFREKVLKPCHSVVIPESREKIRQKNNLDLCYETLRDDLSKLFFELNIAS